jgi:hypothetical protein
MALVAVAPRQVQAVGSFTELACGVAGGSGTTTTVTVPNLKVVQGVLVGGNTSTTAAYCDTVSGNTFTVTTASGDFFTWIAFGKARL